MLELDDLPLIDQHVHVFTKDTGKPGFDPLTTFSLGGEWIDFLDSGGHVPTEAEREQLQTNQRQTMSYHEGMHAIARYLGCEPTREAIIEARNDRVTDYQAYVHDMYRDINLESNIVDLGYPAGVNLEEFQALSGAPAYGLFRIEPMIGRLWDRYDSLAALETAFVDGIGEVAANPRIIALKSVIAYRTGLSVKPLETADVSTAVDNLKRSAEAEGLLARIHVPRSTRADVKALRDYLLWRALELSVELNLPFQIHTGMGDQDLDIETARPGMLGAIFRDEKLRHAKIVLLHGSYPFYEEGAYLANVFPNVYLDLSEFNPLVLPSVRRVIATILEMAPFTKVVYSSDASGAPELQWIAGKKGREALGSVLGEAVDDDRLSQKAARHAAQLILADNVRGIYGL